MTLHEFVALDASDIRKSKDLMQLFVEFYEAAFSFKPSCAGCSFKKGFVKLKNLAKEKTNKNINFEVMKAPNTFKVKKKELARIHSFTKDGRVFRRYGNAIDEEFAAELVKAGKGNIFDILPSTTVSHKPVLEESKGLYESMDYRSELIPLYNDVSERVGDKASSNKKSDVIEFLKRYEN